MYIYLVSDLKNGHGPTHDHKTSHLSVPYSVLLQMEPEPFPIGILLLCTRVMSFNSNLSSLWHWS